MALNTLLTGLEQRIGQIVRASTSLDILIALDIIQPNHDFIFPKFRKQIFT